MELTNSGHYAVEDTYFGGANYRWLVDTMGPPGQPSGRWFRFHPQNRFYFKQAKDAMMYTIAWPKAPDNNPSPVSFG